VKLIILCGFFLCALFSYFIIKRVRVFSSRRISRLRSILIKDFGIVKAEHFSDDRLNRILREINRNKLICQKNPLTIYKIVSKTE